MKNWNWKSIGLVILVLAILAGSIYSQAAPISSYSTYMCEYGQDLAHLEFNEGWLSPLVRSLVADYFENQGFHEAYFVVNDHTWSVDFYKNVAPPVTESSTEKG